MAKMSILAVTTVDSNRCIVQKFDTDVGIIKIAVPCGNAMGTGNVGVGKIGPR